MHPEPYDVIRDMAAQDTIERFMKEGLSEEAAIAKWERICYTKLPEIIRALIKREVNDDIV